MWQNPQEIADLPKFTEEILNEKPHFLSIMTIEFYVTDGPY